MVMEACQRSRPISIDAGGRTAAKLGSHANLPNLGAMRTCQTEGTDRKGSDLIGGETKQDMLMLRVQTH